MKTTGDKILDKSLEQIGGKGLFVKELEKALMEESIDISVHSLKDMPMEVPEDLPLIAYSKREDPRDVLIYKPGQSEITARRRHRHIEQTQDASDGEAVSILYDLQGIRGNVQTRLRKLEEQNFDGTVLAAAGLRRLHMEAIIGRVFERGRNGPCRRAGDTGCTGQERRRSFVPRRYFL